MNFFMVFDIDIHQLNLGEFRILICMKFHSKNVLFCICLIMNAQYKKNQRKSHFHIKEEEIL